MQTKKIMPLKIKNSLKRDREYLTESEVNQLIAAVKKEGRHPLRNSTLILMAYRHGLRISELVSLRWSQVNLKEGLLHVVRKKNGLSGMHPLFGPELRALRSLQRQYPETDYVFLSERKTPLDTSTAREIITEAGKKANLPLSVHPHMLRHATGFKLAKDGIDLRSIQQYLGHKDIAHTVRYTQITNEGFKTFWRD